MSAVTTTTSASPSAMKASAAGTTNRPSRNAAALA